MGGQPAAPSSSLKNMEPQGACLVEYMPVGMMENIDSDEDADMDTFDVDDDSDAGDFICGTCGEEPDTGLEFGCRCGEKD